MSTSYVDQGLALRAFAPILIPGGGRRQEPGVETPGYRLPPCGLENVGERSSLSSKGRRGGCCYLRGRCSGGQSPAEAGLRVRPSGRESHDPAPSTSSSQAFGGARSQGATQGHAASDHPTSWPVRRRLRRLALTSSKVVHRFSRSWWPRSCAIGALDADLLTPVAVAAVVGGAGFRRPASQRRRAPSPPGNARQSTSTSTAPCARGPRRRSSDARPRRRGRRG